MTIHTKSLALKPITLWFRWALLEPDRWGWDYNHFQDGHVEGERPLPPARQSWGGKWRHEHAWLTADRVGRVVLASDREVQGG